MGVHAAGVFTHLSLALCRYYLNSNLTNSSSECATVKAKANDFRAFHLTIENTAPWPQPSAYLLF